uniref:Uncharacterized protein n=1 Tax=Setaria digitata TaxID=48799 RepID=A0A915Q8D6_9BILA
MSGEKQEALRMKQPLQLDIHSVLKRRCLNRLDFSMEILLICLTWWKLMEKGSSVVLRKVQGIRILGVMEQIESLRFAKRIFIAKFESFLVDCLDEEGRRLQLRLVATAVALLWWMLGYFGNCCCQIISFVYAEMSTVVRVTVQSVDIRVATYIPQ